MKQIVIGIYGSGKSIRALKIANDYRGRVIYYSWSECSYRYYLIHHPELMQCFLDDNDKRFISKSAPPTSWEYSTAWKSPEGKLLSLDALDAVNSHPGNVLLVLDDMAWAIGVQSKIGVLKRLSADPCDVIINIVDPFDLQVPPDLLKGWAIYKYTGSDHCFEELDKNACKELLTA